MNRTDILKPFRASDQHPTGLNLDGKTVLYFGKASGTVVLYRIRNGVGQTLRLPQDSVVLVGTP
jgi:hypothetical protein